MRPRTGETPSTVLIKEGPEDEADKQLNKEEQHLDQFKSHYTDIDKLANTS